MSAAGVVPLYAGTCTLCDDYVSLSPLYLRDPYLKRFVSLLYKTQNSEIDSWVI